MKGEVQIFLRSKVFIQARIVSQEAHAAAITALGSREVNA
jgi:hypothetical protein